MVKFADAIDLFCNNIKTILILFILNFIISIPVALIIGLLSIIPALNIIISIIYTMIILNVSVMTFIECYKDTEVSCSMILNYYSQSLSNLGNLLKVCIMPMLKMYLFIFVISIVYFMFLFGSIMALNSNSNSVVFFGLIFILTLLMYIVLIVWLSLKYSIEMNQKLACVYYNDDDFKFYEEYKSKTPFSRYFWFLVPIVGSFLVPLAITKEAKSYYEGDIL